MKRNSDRYRKFSASPEDETSDETSTTRLFAYDLAEVKSMCVDGKTKSDVIRELVRRALYSRRYRQASTDPAFKEILKSFDDQVGVRLHHLEERLIARMEADFDLMLSLVGYLYLAASSGVEELRQVRLLVTPEEVTEEEFMEAWERRFEEAKRSAAALRAQLRKRGGGSGRTARTKKARAAGAVSPLSSRGSSPRCGRGSPARGRSA